MRAALRVREFRRLALVWALINLADSTLFMTIAIWVKDLTGSDSAAGLVFAAIAVPAIFAPLTGHLADRMSRRRLVSGAGVVAAGTVPALLLVHGDGGLWLVYLVTIGYSAIGLLISAAQSGLVRDLMPDASLASANGLLTTIDQGLRLVSPLIGAGLYFVAGIEAVVVLTAALFALSAVGMLLIRVPETPPTLVADRLSFWLETTAGFRHLAGTPGLNRLLLAMAIAIGACGVTNTTNFAAIERGLGTGPELLGVLASLQGVGAIAGGLTAAVLIGRIGERYATALGLSLLAAGVLTTMTTSPPLIYAGLLAAGVGVTWAVIAFVTMRQRLTPPTLQGRASAASNMAINLPQAAATLLAAAVIVAVDYRIMVLVTGLTVLGAAVVCLPRGASVPATREEPSAVG